MPSEILTEFEKKLKQKAMDRYAGTIGLALQREYPTINWLVDIEMERNGGVAAIRAPDISRRFGMWIKLSETDHLLEQEAREAGGELLERFNVSRGETGDRDVIELPRLPNGETHGADKGELKT